MNNAEYMHIVLVMPREMTSGPFDTASDTAAPTSPQFAIGPQKCVVFQL